MLEEAREREKKNLDEINRLKNCEKSGEIVQPNSSDQSAATPEKKLILEENAKLKQKLDETLKQLKLQLEKQHQQETKLEASLDTGNDASAISKLVIPSSRHPHLPLSFRHPLLGSLWRL